MNEVKITMFTKNDAFREYPQGEVARILRELADKIENDETPRTLRDINGNTVGVVEYK